MWGVKNGKHPVQTIKRQQQLAGNLTFNVPRRARVGSSDRWLSSNYFIERGKFIDKNPFTSRLSLCSLTVASGKLCATTVRLVRQGPKVAETKTLASTFSHVQGVLSHDSSFLFSLVEQRKSSAHLKTQKQHLRANKIRIHCFEGLPHDSRSLSSFRHTQSVCPGNINLKKQQHCQSSTAQGKRRGTKWYLVS